MSLLIILTFFSHHALSIETCSRTAIVNYQEVLIDTSSNEKGEGLRFYLEKDEIAKKYLDEYQEGTKIGWHNAALGTLGTGSIVASLFTNDDSSKRQGLLIVGAVLIGVNFFVARTLENRNEDNLLKAIEEYNKRNLPKIYFNPESSNEDAGQNTQGYQISLGKSWSF